MTPDRLGQDLRHAWRSLSRAPSLTAIVILTVALGVGASTALFSVVKAVLLNPLPYSDPDRLVWVAAITGGRESRTSMPDFVDLRAESQSFSGLAAYGDGPFLVGGGGLPERTSGSLVTADFFDVLGVQPALGRSFSPDEHKPGAPLATSIISHGLWQRAYGGDPSIVGRRITIVGRASTVIGVMPAGFAFPAGTDVWVSADAINEGNVRTAHNYWVIGRLRPEVTVHAAHREMSAIAQRLARQYAGPYQTEDVTLTSLAAHLVGGIRTPLLLLFGAVGLLLLIVCVNVANLLLVRMTSRARELAVRTAVGAGRADLVRHMLVESAMLAGAGGALGVLVCVWSTTLLRVMLPASVPRGGDVRIDAGVIAFGVAVSAASALVFGLLPAWRSARLDVHDVLKSGARGQTATRRSRQTHALLVVSEVALSLMLLAGAGLLVDSFARLRAVHPGFEPGGVLTANISFPVTNREEVGRLVSRYRDLLGRVRAIPGVEAAGTLKDLPLDPIQRSSNFFIENRPKGEASEGGHLVVTPGAMEAMRIPILRGRALGEHDSEGAAGAAVISDAMARRFWPGRDPIGERIWFNGFDPKEHWLTIVGVAGDVRQLSLTEPAPAQAYVSYAQTTIRAQLGQGNLIVRSAGDPKSLIPAVRAALREVHPEAAATFRTMDDVMAEATARQRFQMEVLAAFAALALILASVGLYGVLSYGVTSSRAAIGIRIALGARPAQIFGMVSSRAFGLTAAGAGIGLIACLALGRVMQKVVYGVSPSDPRVLALAVGVLLVTAMAACWFPARRAMRVDPVIALREE